MRLFIFLQCWNRCVYRFCVGVCCLSTGGYGGFLFFGPDLATQRPNSSLVELQSGARMGLLRPMDLRAYILMNLPLVRLNRRLRIVA